MLKSYICRYLYDVLIPFDVYIASPNWLKYSNWKEAQEIAIYYMMFN